MHKSKLNECIPLDKALARIKSNQGASFDWYPVDNGLCKFELGGTRTDLKAYVSNVIDGKVVVHANDYVDTRYALVYKEDGDGTGHYCAELPTVNGTWKKIKRADFVKILRKDLNSMRIEIKSYREIIVHPTAVLVI